jgi:short-subunit dehydrogenase
MQLKGKSIFITGGTGGIGIPLVALLEKAGAKVRKFDRQKEGDLYKNIDQVAKELAENTPDILINMAGFNDFSFCENQKIDAIVGLNLIVPIRLSQAVLPAMKARNSGQIVNIGSMVGLIPLPHFTGYSSSKAGLKAFSVALQRELEGSAITVTHISPRAVHTNMNNDQSDELNQKTGVHYDKAEDVAKRIFKAILINEHDVRLGWPERFFAFLNAIFPNLISKGLQKNRMIGETILKRVGTKK